MHKSTVLVVDDSLYMHKMVRAHLESEPVVIHSCYDAFNGLKRAAELRPNLILMDVDMPEMDGLQACRQLKSNSATIDTPLLFLTADDSVNNKVKALDMGAVDYITKPFNPDELRARVRSALRVSHNLDNTRVTDTLTGLWNQVYLQRNLPIQLSLANRTSQALSCICAEVDSLEALAMKHGSDFRDHVLKAVADIFRGQTRTEDLLCHSGDGKFIVLLPATTRAGAGGLAHRVRIEIEQQLMLFNQVAANVTCSFGISDNASPGTLSMLDSAELAMAQSKNSGGNNLIIHGGFGSTDSLAA